eukprot:1157228-Pelagomonas_calceolata.AAC.6
MPHIQFKHWKVLTPILVQVPHSAAGALLLQGGHAEQGQGAAQGEARPGKTRQGKTRQDQARQGKARPGKERQGKTRPGKERPGKTRQGKERPGQTRPGQTRQGKARPGQARQGKARQGKARKDQARPDKVRHFNTDTGVVANRLRQGKGSIAAPAYEGSSTEADGFRSRPVHCFGRRQRKHGGIWADPRKLMHGLEHALMCA